MNGVKIPGKNVVANGLEQVAIQLTGVLQCSEHLCPPTPALSSPKYSDNGSFIVWRHLWMPLTGDLISKFWTEPSRPFKPRAGIVNDLDKNDKNITEYLVIPTSQITIIHLAIINSHSINIMVLYTKRHIIHTYG